MPAYPAAPTLTENITDTSPATPDIHAGYHDVMHKYWNSFITDLLAALSGETSLSNLITTLKAAITTNAGAISANSTAITNEVTNRGTAVTNEQNSRIAADAANLNLSIAMAVALG